MAYKDKEKQREAQRRYEEKRKAKITRTIWWGYLYPESAPEDWEQRLRGCGIEALAQLHDKDVDATGTPKKPHVHIALRFSHAVDKARATEELTNIGVLESSVQYRDSWRAVARYLCHMDDPDKYQYDSTKVIEVGGADYYNAIGRTSDKYRTILEMQKFIREHEIYDFAEFMDYCADENMEWFMALCDNCSVIIEKYMKSRRYMRRDQLQAQMLYRDNRE